MLQKLLSTVFENTKFKNCFSTILGVWTYEKKNRKYLILQSLKIKLYDLLCIFLRGWVREFNYAKSTVLIDRVIFASWHYEIMLWTCCYTRKGCWLARLGRVSVAVVHGWTDETAHLEYAKRKSNPRKEKPIGWRGASSHTTRKYDSMASSRKDTLLAISWCTGCQKRFLNTRCVVISREQIICSSVKKKRLIQNLPADLVTVRPHVIIRHGNMSSCH